MGAREEAAGTGFWLAGQRDQRSAPGATRSQLLLKAGTLPSRGPARGGSSAGCAVLVVGKFAALSRLIIRDLELDRAAVGRLENGSLRIDSGSAHTRPHLAIVIEPEVAGAVTTIRALKHRWPDVRVLVYGAADREGAVLSCVAARADGLIASDEPLQHLAQAVREVLSDGFHLPPRLARPLMRRLIHLDAESRQRGGPKVPGLSGRQAGILAGLAHGKSNKEIAAALGLQVQTVKNHVHNILRKLGVHNRYEAARAATQVEGCR
jgi:two-component system nitrate/nitrite response regulator NarL